MEPFGIRRIDRAHREDLALPNPPFPLFGRLAVSYDGERWSGREELFPPEKVSEMCFPAEHYDFDALAGDHIFLGAYSGERCVGLAVLRQAFFGYMYLQDLKVDASCRRQGVGRLLVEEALRVSIENRYRGLYLQAQDNNLAACRFYLACGFRIGGLDTELYCGTSQEGKADILFYRDAV